MRSHFKFYFTRFSIFICFFLMLVFSSFTSHASSYFPIYQNENNLIPDAVYNYVLNNYGQYFFIRYVGNDGTYTSYYYVSFSASTNKPLATILPNGYQFSLVNTNVVNNGRIRVVNSTGQITRDSNNGGFNNAYTNLTSSSYSSSFSYRSNFELFTSGGEGVLLIFVPITVPDSGHSQSYFNNIPQFGYPIGMHPTSAPSVPTYTQPTLTTAPSIDTTNINTIAQSIFILLSWVLQSILSYFGSIIQTLIDWFTFISNLSIWIADFIKQCFIALMDFLYNNFTTLFEPIFNFYSSIFKTLFNTDEQLSIWDLLFSLVNFLVSWLGNYWSNSWLANFFTNLIATYSTIQGYFEDLQSYFSKVALFFTTLVALGTSNGEFSITTLTTALFFPSSNQVLAIVEAQDTYGFLGAFSHLAEVFGGFVADLEDLEGAFIITLPSFTILGVQIDQQDIDFSWYLDLKPIGDGIISAFLIFGYLYWLFIRLSGILRGITAPASSPSELSDDYPKGSIIQRY